MDILNVTIVGDFFLFQRLLGWDGKRMRFDGTGFNFICCEDSLMMMK